MNQNNFIEKIDNKKPEKLFKYAVSDIETILYKGEHIPIALMYLTDVKKKVFYIEKGDNMKKVNIY